LLLLARDRWCRWCAGDIRDSETDNNNDVCVTVGEGEVSESVRGWERVRARKNKNKFSVQLFFPATVTARPERGCARVCGKQPPSRFRRLAHNKERGRRRWRRRRLSRLWHTTDHQTERRTRAHTHTHTPARSNPQPTLGTLSSAVIWSRSSPVVSVSPDESPVHHSDLHVHTHKSLCHSYRPHSSGCSFEMLPESDRCVSFNAPQKPALSLRYTSSFLLVQYDFVLPCNIVELRGQIMYHSYVNIHRLWHFYLSTILKILN